MSGRKRKKKQNLWGILFGLSIIITVVLTWQGRGLLHLFQLSYSAIEDSLGGYVAAMIGAVIGTFLAIFSAAWLDKLSEIREEEKNQKIYASILLADIQSLINRATSEAIWTGVTGEKYGKAWGERISEKLRESVYYSFLSEEKRVEYVSAMLKVSDSDEFSLEDANCLLVFYESIGKKMCKSLFQGEIYKKWGPLFNQISENMEKIQLIKLERDRWYSILQGTKEELNCKIKDYWFRAISKQHFPDEKFKPEMIRWLKEFVDRDQFDLVGGVNIADSERYKDNIQEYKKFLNNLEKAVYQAIKDGEKSYKESVIKVNGGKTAVECPCEGEGVAGYGEGYWKGKEVSELSFIGSERSSLQCRSVIWAIESCVIGYCPIGEHLKDIFLENEMQETCEFRIKRDRYYRKREEWMFFAVIYYLQRERNGDCINLDKREKVRTRLMHGVEQMRPYFSMEGSLAEAIPEDAIDEIKKFFGEPGNWIPEFAEWNQKAVDQLLQDLESAEDFMKPYILYKFMEDNEADVSACKVSENSRIMKFFQVCKRTMEATYPISSEIHDIFSDAQKKGFDYNSFRYRDRNSFAKLYREIHELVKSTNKNKDLCVYLKKLVDLDDYFVSEILPKAIFLNADGKNWNNVFYMNIISEDSTLERKSAIGEYIRCRYNLEFLLLPRFVKLLGMEDGDVTTVAADSETMAALIIKNFNLKPIIDKLAVLR